MNSKEFEKKRRAIWANFERQHALPVSPVPERVRNIIEVEIGVGFHDYETDLKDLEDELPTWMRPCEIYGNYVLERTKYEAKSKPKDGSQKRIYGKCLERRLYLVEFVTERVLGFHNLIDRSFTPHKRIGWKRLAVLWNKKHPYDTMTPDRLRQEFYRIIKDESVKYEFFNKQDNLFAQFATDEFRKEAAIFAEAMYETSRAHGVDFDFTQGEPIEIRWLIKQLGEPPADEWKLNYMSMLIHNAIEAIKSTPHSL